MKALCGALLSVLMIATSVQVNAEEVGEINIFGGVGRLFFDDELNVDDATVGQGGIGYRLNDRWSVEAVYLKADTEVDGANVDVDVDAYRLDGLYHLESDGAWKPFLALGLGEMDFDNAISGSDDEVFANIGAGVKRQIAGGLSFRADARIIQGFDESSASGLVTLGLDYAFGGRKSTAKKARPAPSDADGDGVIDANDQCPDTPVGVAVDSTGCPTDSDRDGVADYKDQCPNTPAGARVDDKGCQIVIKETVRVELEVLFDFNGSTVKPEYFGEIKRVAEFMKLFPATSASIEGHTDSKGPDSYNQSLSQRRANAVRGVLIGEHGVDASRLTATGYGESKPVAGNSTKEDRAKNRRVVAEIKTDVEKKATK